MLRNGFRRAPVVLRGDAFKASSGGALPVALLSAVLVFGQRDAVRRIALAGAAGPSKRRGGRARLPDRRHMKARMRRHSVSPHPKKLMTHPKRLMTHPKRLMVHPKKLMTHPKKLMTHPKKLMTHPKKLMVHPKRLMVHPKRLMMHPKRLMTHPKKLMTHPKNVIVCRKNAEQSTVP